jgi:hypothetical protein
MHHYYWSLEIGRTFAGAVVTDMFGSDVWTGLVHSHGLDATLEELKAKGILPDNATLEMRRD